MLLVALWAALAHAAEAEDKLLARQIIAENWPELASACGLGLTLQPQPEWDAPPDGALRARCVNGAKFYIKLTSPADLVWKGGPTVFRCDGAFARRHKVPGAVKRRPPFPQHGTQIRDWVPPWLGDF